MSGGGAFRPPQAFLRMGLKSNPFNLLDPHELAARVPPQPWIRRLAARPWDVLVLHGPSGLGKTSAARMIERLVAPREAARYVRLPERGARWPTPGDEALLVVDSVQRIAPWRRRGVRTLVAPGARRVLLCGHLDPTRGLRLPGVIERVVPPPPDLEEVVGLYRLYLTLALRPGAAPPPPPLDEDVARDLLGRAGGSRFALHHLQYLAFERLADRGATTPRLTRDLLEGLEPVP